MKKNLFIICIVSLLVTMFFSSCEPSPKKDKDGNILDFDNNIIGDKDGRAVDLLNDNGYIFYAENDESVYLLRPGMTTNTRAFYNLYVYDKKSFTSGSTYKENNTVPTSTNKFVLKTQNNAEKKNGITSSSFDRAYPNGMGIESGCIYNLECPFGDKAVCSVYEGEVEVEVDYLNSELINKDVKSYSFYFRKPHSKKNDNNTLKNFKLLNLYFTPWAKTSSTESAE